ncbi:MAG TPA: hypothetical protein VGR61_05685, partial [Candidatus Dormibacteraeota bacterium]|nr:hypothetical protein [Candidatus Dormibacteraeota bacterium]
APGPAASTETAQGPPPRAEGAAAPGAAGAVAPTAAAGSLPRRARTVVQAALRVPPAPAQPPRWYWLGIVPATLTLLLAALAWRRRGPPVGTN